jgi:hypothetical protein
MDFFKKVRSFYCRRQIDQLHWGLFWRNPVVQPIGPYLEVTGRYRRKDGLPWLPTANEEHPAVDLKFEPGDLYVDVKAKYELDENLHEQFIKTMYFCKQKYAPMVLITPDSVIEVRVDPKQPRKPVRYSPIITSSDPDL